MDWSIRYPQTQQPTLEQISASVDSPLWTQLRFDLEQTYHVAPKVEYSRCSAAPGWNVKYRKGSRALCTLYPEEGGFTAMVSIGSRDPLAVEAEIAQCSAYVQELFSRANPFNGSRWLMIRISDRQTLADAERLIAFRMRK